MSEKLMQECYEQSFGKRWDQAPEKDQAIWAAAWDASRATLGIAAEMREGLEWAVARCKALQSQGFTQTRHDVLIRDLNAPTLEALKPGLGAAIAVCQNLMSQGFTHSTLDVMIYEFEARLAAATR